VRQVLGVSDSRARCTPGQHRSTQRKIPCGLPNEECLTGDIIALTREYGHYVYRMIAGMLNNSGWHVNHKRVERIWRDTWETRRKAEMAIFEYINGFYNPRRGHSVLGWKSPVAFERKVA
jgi:transposase InsO family protein